MQYPNRAEMVIIVLIVSLINDAIIYLMGAPDNHYLYYPLIVVIFFEEFVQFSIISYIKNEKLFGYCLKYAFIFWSIESIFKYIEMLHDKSDLADHFFISLVAFVYARSCVFSMYFMAAISRFYCFTRLRNYAAVLFLVQVVIHTAWDINQPPIIDAIFAPIIKLEQILEGSQ
jgi:hypothetical protein